MAELRIVAKPDGSASIEVIGVVESATELGLLYGLATTALITALGRQSVQGDVVQRARFLAALRQACPAAFPGVSGTEVPHVGHHCN